MSEMSERTGLLVGEEGIRRLAEASVVLTGAGAVGGYALEGLVRAGIGRIRVVDADVFSPSNLNRQVLATVDTVGRPKAEVACERARSINPGIDIEPMSVLVDDSTVGDVRPRGRLHRRRDPLGRLRRAGRRHRHRQMQDLTPEKGLGDRDRDVLIDGGGPPSGHPEGARGAPQEDIGVPPGGRRPQGARASWDRCRRSPPSSA